MASNGFTIQFEPLRSVPSGVRVVHHRMGKEGVFRLTLDDTPLRLRNSAPISKAVADIIDFAVALHTADRVASPRKNESRHIRIVVPLRNPARFASSEVREALEEVVWWCSPSDEWDFVFTQREGQKRQSEQQGSLFPTVSSECEVALWSGGLDSLAGLVQRVSQEPYSDFLLFGSGSNEEVNALQCDLVKELQSRIPHAGIELSQVIIRPRGLDDIPGRRNASPRLRGLVFMLLGAARAASEGQSKLHVYENGVGAVNLSFAGGRPGIDHSRATHPKTLRLTAHLASAILEHPFDFKNSFLFNTKAWMCEAVHRYKLDEVVGKTISCDSKPRRSFGESKVRHCGKCSSCLLRWQALAAAGVEDGTNYAISMPGVEIEPGDRQHFRAMMNQVDRLSRCLESPNPDRALQTDFPELFDVNRSERRRLTDLYRHYVGEWEKLRSAAKGNSAAPPGFSKAA